MKANHISRRHFVRTGAAVAAAGFGTPIRASAETVLKMSLPVGPADPMSVTSAKFAEHVAKRSNGAIRVEIYYNGTLAKQQASISGMQTGIVDLTLQTTAFLEPISPRVQALDLPFLFGSRPAAERVLDGDIGRELSAEIAQKGILILAWGTNGWRDMELAKKRVTKPEDMRGLRMRIQNGPVYAAMMRALGAVPVVIDFSETYTALAQNTVDGLEIPPPTVLSTKVYEVVKSISLTNHMYNPAPLMMSKAKFDSMPAAERKVIDDVSREILSYWRGLYIIYEKQALTELRNKKIELDEVDQAAFKRAMTPVYEEFRAKVGAAFVDRIIKQSGS